VSNHSAASPDPVLCDAIRVKALRDTSAESARTTGEDLELIQSFASGDPSAAQEARFRDWFGWKPSQGTPCPRVLAGKRCQAHKYDSDPCLCEWAYSHVLDHPRRWRDQHGRPILTAEPYEFDGEVFAQLVTGCTQLGLDVSVYGTSPYFPGRTILIIIRKAHANAAEELP
jgi:hypothetical protein